MDRKNSKLVVDWVDKLPLSLKLHLEPLTFRAHPLKLLCAIPAMNGLGRLPVLNFENTA